MSLPSLSLFVAGAVLATSASAVTSWNLSADYLEDTNPNGAWTYGALPGGTFTALAWNAGTASYGVAAVGEAFLYKRTAAGTDYGIDSGEVSLEADWGNPAVRWTAPVTAISNEPSKSPISTGVAVNDTPTPTEAWSRARARSASAPADGGSAASAVDDAPSTTPLADAPIRRG